MSAVPHSSSAAPGESYWSHHPGARRPRHVTVIGAGIVGLASAAALRRDGHEVTVIDAAPQVGQGTSFGNGCQLSYGYVAPLAQPSLLPELPSLLLAKNAPLKIVPRMEPAQWRWMAQFLLACRGAKARQSSLDLLALGSLSRSETDLWLRGADRAQLKYSAHGKLVLLPTAQALAKARAQLHFQAGHGPLQRAVSEDDVLRMEPALARFKGRIAGAIHTPSECAVDSHALCLDMERELRARGVEFRLATRVTGFERAGRRVTHLIANCQALEVDRLVLATGPATAAVGRMLGLSLPVYQLKGYSITARIVEPDAVPRVSVTDAARKVVYARIGDHLRVAGVAEIRGYDSSIEPGRIAELVAHTRQAFGAAVDLDSVAEWSGLRPATPSSVPIIGAAPLDNVFLNVGHGALGLTLAFGAAATLADKMNVL